ncbi:ribosomal protein L20 [Candidatus Phytoplasma oryzae]|uniref:Large ribosomal subunit protein bL20 n=1 Tax=Candidatus Phytoplasma oryzae TaxID=203274 RepID=A0A139JQQ6_9MOLU|nr:50S ribosomal protein L20 [Candidatus Phytoplasma oryzae]KXT29311.1 ribosomal protein L20 [Candidatus Phytoplasma oryzae]RAM57866.1 50S ribosomal protein L20 [Candidatus Phytoplasma oryzae]
MVKINFTNARHKRRKKVLKMAKGYFGSKKNLYKTAHEQVMRSLQYAYRDRRQKKRNFRRLWIIRINAGCKNNNISYSSFIHGLILSKIEVNRKILADIAFSQPEMFTEYVNLSKNSLNQKKNNILKINEDNNQNVFNDSLKNIQIKNIKIIEKKKKIDNNSEIKISPIVPNDQNNRKEMEKKIELDKMLLYDLKKIAKEKKIKNFSKLNKKELINILKKI